MECSGDIKSDKTKNIDGVKGCLNQAVYILIKADLMD